MSSALSHRLGITAAIAVLALGALTGCGDETAAPQEPGAQQPAPSQPGDVDAGQGDYAFGTDRDTMAKAIESAFSSKSPTASWNGDTLILALGIEAPETMPGFTECNVLSHLLLETDSAKIQFASGELIDCDSF